MNIIAGKQKGAQNIANFGAIGIVGSRFECFQYGQIRIEIFRLILCKIADLNIMSCLNLPAASL